MERDLKFFLLKTAHPKRARKIRDFTVVGAATQDHRERIPSLTRKRGLGKKPQTGIWTWT